MTEIQVPRVVIGGTTSGVGKTTIAVGLMAALVRRGLKGTSVATCWRRLSTCIWRPTQAWPVASWPHAPSIQNSRGAGTGQSEVGSAKRESQSRSQ
jgi:hypothetical protein